MYKYHHLTTYTSSFTEIVSLITNDGRNIVGILKGFDQSVNLILDQSHERVYSPDAPVEQIPRGLFVIRGDNV
jgi:U6 snRNA-associated Sm-like protein LSm8